MRTVLLLLGSNIFMNIAWYGHLTVKHAAIWVIILVSWLIALPEYALQVPANRIGMFEEGYSPPQLKILQEAISIGVFIVLSAFVLKAVPRWNEWAAFVLIFAAVLLARWTPAADAAKAGEANPPAVDAKQNPDSTAK